MQDKQVPLTIAIITLMAYTILWVWGKFHDFFDSFSSKQSYARAGYAPLRSDNEDFFTRRMYFRISNVFNRPICTAASTWIAVMERVWKDKQLVCTGTARRCLNLGSYNYLGFGDPENPCRFDVFNAVDHYSAHTCSSRPHLGTTPLHIELEKTVARFVGKEAAMVFGMGFGTNSTGIPALVGKGGLIISDALNHSSIINGARSSGASIATFKHNDPKDLERVIRKHIVEGQPRSHRPWNKILIIVEGIYSMEGEMCPLAEIVAVKNKYKCYLYVDEAHSIGAIGPNGRGICDQKNVDPAQVDILMGTFTKSFGSVGGYIASSKDVIERIKVYSAGHVYSASVSPPAAQQVISAMKVIMGEDGTNIGRTKLDSLRNNCVYFRRRLAEMGCLILGEDNSPVIPLILGPPAMILRFSELCFERNMAIVGVGYPATPLLLSRTRVCISAGHKMEELKVALDRIEEVVDLIGLRYQTHCFPFGCKRRNKKQHEKQIHVGNGMGKSKLAANSQEAAA